MERDPQYKTYYEYLAKIGRVQNHNFSTQKKAISKKNEEAPVKHCIDVPKVIGSNNCRKLIEYILPFPIQFPAISILESVSEVRNIKTNPCTDGVFIEGTLLKLFTYQTCDGTFKYMYSNLKHQGLCGSIRFISAELPFSCFINIPGTKSGDTVNIKYSGVDESLKFYSLEEPVSRTENIYKEFKKLNAKDMLELEVEVTRITQVSI